MSTYILLCHQACHILHQMHLINAMNIVMKICESKFLKGEKEKLEQLCEHLKGKILEYDITEDMAISSDLQKH